MSCLHMTAVIGVLPFTRATSAGSPHFPCSYTYLILRRVLKCQTPASNQSLHFLKIFLQTQKSACRETMRIYLLLLIP